MFVSFLLSLLLIGLILFLVFIEEGGWFFYFKMVVWVLFLLFLLYVIWFVDSEWAIFCMCILFLFIASSLGILMVLDSDHKQRLGCRVKTLLFFFGFSLVTLLDFIELLPFWLDPLIYFPTVLLVWGVAFW